MYLKFNHMLPFNQPSVPRSCVRSGWFSGHEIQGGCQRSAPCQCRKYHDAAGWKSAGGGAGRLRKRSDCCVGAPILVCHPATDHPPWCLWHFASCHVCTFFFFFIIIIVFFFSSCGCCPVTVSLSHGRGKLFLLLNVLSAMKRMCQLGWA